MCFVLPHTLMILEVSQKQAYIFGSRRLKENIERSEQIRYVTSPEFFSLVCADDFCPAENLVYTGGGHTVLQFGSAAAADRFARAVTRTVLQTCPSIELFVRSIRYDPSQTAGENLLALSQALEEKKSLRRASFYRRELGIEQRAEARCALPGLVQPAAFAPEGWALTNQVDQLTDLKDENFVAVVHIDGNAMGARVQNIYRLCTEWDDCCRMLRQFSQGIDADFNAAYEETVTELTHALQQRESRGEYACRRTPQNQPILPVRRVIGAGDDVCFVTGGFLGLEAAVLFMEKLAQKQNAADGLGYAACAGVALVHTRFPFRAAYDLSEQLCSSAKRAGVQWAADGSVCAIDWHIEFGQLKGSLAQHRQDYIAADGSSMTLRPLAVAAPPPVMNQIPRMRRYRYFRSVTAALQAGAGAPVRSKLKALRESAQQGEVETELAVRWMQIGSQLMEIGVYDREGDVDLRSGRPHRRALYADKCTAAGETVRCNLYYDAIELMDHTTLWKEEPLQ